LNLREEILKEHSKAQCNYIIKWVGDSQKCFDELFDLFLKSEDIVVQRAAWPVSYCVEAHPHFINDHFAHLIKYLQKPHLHDAVKRNSIRMLKHVSIPKKYQGPIMNICFDYVASPAEAVAIKSFSLMVLSNLAKDYPEIIPEIKYLIEDQLPHQTAGFKRCAKKVLKEFAEADNGINCKI
jgi:hypothetical protein